MSWESLALDKPEDDVTRQNQFIRLSEYMALGACMVGHGHYV